MPRIQADQIEVGAGPQHAITKYGPGPGWELEASRLRDTGAVIDVPGREVNIGDLAALVNNGTGARFVDEDRTVVIAANGKNPNTFAKLDMVGDPGDIARATLSARFSSITTHLALEPESLTATLGFIPTDEGTLNLNAETINLNATTNLTRNGIQLGTTASVALENQNSDVPGILQVDGATPPKGLYRLSYYLVTTTPGTSGTVKATFVWTDSAAPRSVDSATLAFGTLAAPASGSLVVQSDGINPITYTTVIDSAVGDPEYALYITLERLQ